uniref:Uncharacterized protein n=1 Tax=Arundo donax TaxID=35708 RepID=A0A0A9C6Q2_ARUDO
MALRMVTQVRKNYKTSEEF